MKRFSIKSTVLACSVVAITAHAGLFDDTEARKQIAEQRADQQQMADRLAKLEAALNNQRLLELVKQLEQSNTEISKLHGEIEVLQHQLGEMEKRAKDLYLDTDTRLRKIETDTPVSTSEKASDPVDTSKTSVADSTGNPANENAAYDDAFKQFRMGNYPAAIAGFQAFLKGYSQSRLAPNAQYWIGMGYSAQRDYKKAITEQQKVASNYPDSAKVPDALLNIASSQQEQGETKAAQKTLETIVAKYPLAPAAEQAKKRLASMK